MAVEPNSKKVPYDKKYGALPKVNQIVMFFLDDNDMVVFDKRKLSVQDYSEWKDNKKWRVTHPFITSWRHGFSSFLGRPGVPSYPNEIVGSLFGEEDGAASEE